MPQGCEPEQPLAGCRFALTGKFSSLTHEEMAQLIADLGGRVDRLPTRETNYLLIGQQYLPVDEEARPTLAFEKARKLKIAGYEIEFLRERQFWPLCQMEEVSEDVKRLYTIGQLTQLLGVPRDKLRSWLHAGLISPAEIVHRLPFFDFAQVQNAKMLCDLARRGILTSRIRDSLEQVRRWLPEVDSSLAQLALLEENGRLLVRYGDGRMAEASGQLHFDFGEKGSTSLLKLSHAAATEDLFEQALELDDQGQHREAEAIYRRMIELDPEDPVLYFNLAHVEYAQGRSEAAAADYLRVVQLDPEYVEAWSGLGCVLSELGRNKEAISALRHAIALVPQFGDAHFNLADILEQEGELAEAAEHFRLYLKLDQTSVWAEVARDRLQFLEGPAAQVLS